MVMYGYTPFVKLLQHKHGATHLYHIGYISMDVNHSLHTNWSSEWLAYSYFNIAKAIFNCTGC